MTYDRQMAKTEKAGLRAFRERLLADASGDVLEIGGGTGANLSCYGSAVGSLTITEPHPPMLRRLERSVRSHRPDAKVLRAPAEDLPFEGMFWAAGQLYGFTFAQVEHTALPKAPPFVRPAIVGSATVPAAAPRAPQAGDRPTVAPPRAARPAG